MSETESDSDISCLSGISVATTRSRRSVACPNYTDKSDSDDSDDPGERLKRRIDEVLGSDSGSDGEYIPDTKNKKRKHHHKDDFATDDVDSDNEAMERSALDQTVEETSDDSDQGGHSLSSSRSSWKSWKPKETNAQTLKSPRSPPRKTAKKKYKYSFVVDLSEVFVRPSTLKLIEGDSGQLLSLRQASLSTNSDRDKKDVWKSSYKAKMRWRKFHAHLRNSFRLLGSNGDTGGVCSLVNSALQSNCSLFDITFNLESYIYNKNWFKYSEDTYVPLCLLVVDSINSHINSKSLRAAQLRMLGEVVMFFHKPAPIFSYIFKLLVDLGAFQELKQLAFSIKGNTRGKHVLLDPNLRLNEDLLEMITCQESLAYCDNLSESSTQSKLLSDAISTEVDSLLENADVDTTFLLPLYAWYLDQNKDFQAVVDMFNRVIDQFPANLEAHKTLVDWLLTHGADEDILIEALDRASDIFPYEDFAVQFCQIVLRKEEPLDESFSSEDGVSSTPGIDRGELVKKLIKYLDFRDNRNNGQAWDLLLNLSLHLVHTANQESVLQNLLEPRKDWWFKQCSSDPLNCDTVCLGKKIIFLQLILGQDALVEQLTENLRERGNCGDRRIDSVLADIKIHSRNHTKPVLTPASSQTSQGDQDFQEEWEAIANMKSEHECVQNQPWYKDIKVIGGNNQIKKYNRTHTAEESNAYLRNFLHMSTENKFKVMEMDLNNKTFNENYKRLKNTFWKDIRGRKDEVIKCMQQNLVDRRTLETILIDEGIIESYSLFRLFRSYMDRYINNIDWSHVNTVLAEARPQPNLDENFSKKFLQRTREIMRNKLNPRLAVEKAGSEVQLLIRSKHSEDNDVGTAQAEALEVYMKELLDKL